MSFDREPITSTLCLRKEKFPEALALIGYSDIEDLLRHWDCEDVKELDEDGNWFGIEPSRSSVSVDFLEIIAHLLEDGGEYAFYDYAVGGVSRFLVRDGILISQSAVIETIQWEDD